MKTTKDILWDYAKNSLKEESEKYYEFLDKKYYSEEELRKAFEMGKNDLSEKEFQEWIIKKNGTRNN